MGVVGDLHCMCPLCGHYFLDQWRGGVESIRVYPDDPLTVSEAEKVVGRSVRCPFCTTELTVVLVSPEPTHEVFVKLAPSSWLWSEI
jgi:hypothetical protein